MLSINDKPMTRNHRNTQYLKPLIVKHQSKDTEEWNTLHIYLSHDQLQTALLIGENIVKLYSPQLNGKQVMCSGTKVMAKSLKCWTITVWHYIFCTVIVQNFMWYGKIRQTV